MLNRYSRLWLFLAALVATSAATQANATAISLGTVSSASTLSFSSGGLGGTFEDIFSFTIDTGKTFDVSSFASTGFVTRYGIADFSGTLFDVDGVVALGISGTRFLPEGFPAYDVTFDPVLLGEGDYELRLTGTASGAFPGITAAYDGTVSFADATTVPEPASLALAGLAIAGLGMMRRRVKRASHED